MCPFCKKSTFKKRGFYSRWVESSELIQRFHCKSCSKSFSALTGTPFWKDRLPQHRRPVFALLSSGVSQRRSAKLIGIDRGTVARKVIRFGESARLANKNNAPKAGSDVVVFDEMESFEHTKCKPLSIPIAVEQDSRKIIAIRVCSMPAKGLLAKISRKKYGPRKDDRVAALGEVLEVVKKNYPKLQLLKSDKCPRYPSLVRREFPNTAHQAYKGRRGCVVGQGELKRGGFDPLFSLNHTCAMIRDNIKRLSRRTWCTTKDPQRLQDLLDIYIFAHNFSLGMIEQQLVDAFFGFVDPINTTSLKIPNCNDTSSSNTAPPPSPFIVGCIKQ